MKPKPGVCGQPKTGERNGHIYREGQLMRVRCRKHNGAAFEASPGSDELHGDWEDTAVDYFCL